MICMECKRPIKPFVMGAYLRCCNGIGYYWHEGPKPIDAMFSVAAPKTKYGYLYRDWFKVVPRAQQK